MGTGAHQPSLTDSLAPLRGADPTQPHRARPILPRISSNCTTPRSRPPPGSHENATGSLPCRHPAPDNRDEPEKAVAARHDARARAICSHQSNKHSANIECWTLRAYPRNSSQPLIPSSVGQAASRRRARRHAECLQRRPVSDGRDGCEDSLSTLEQHTQGPRDEAIGLAG